MWRQVWFGLVAAVLASGTGTWAEEPAALTPSDAATPGAGRDDRARGRLAPAARVPEAAVELGEFWLGVYCFAAPPMLADQLGLAEHGGLVVEKVVPQSPAERAGLKPHDVIVRAGQGPVGDIPDLIDAVNEAGESELKLEIIRGGRREAVAAKPARRPREDQTRVWREPPAGDDLDRLRQWLGRMAPDEEWRRPLRLHFFHPGAILPPGAEVHPPLPDDLSVTIHKQGAKPTKVTVQRGDDAWELLEHELDQLPDDVRPHVERMLGRFPVAGPGGVRILPRLPGQPADPELPGAMDDASPDFHGTEQYMQRQLDEMGHRIEELRRSLKRWREHRTTAPPEQPRDGRSNSDPA